MMAEIKRLVGVVVSPAGMFEDVSQKPSWIFPLVPLIIVNLATPFVLFRKLVNDSILKEWRPLRGDRHPNPCR